MTLYLLSGLGADQRAFGKLKLHDTSPAFLRWALHEVLHWKNDTRPEGVTHIHGTADRIFPFTNTRAEIPVKGAGHFMVYTHAPQISAMLVNLIGKHF